MTTEQQLIEALQTAVKTQTQLIECLKIEIERLKSSQHLVLSPLPSGTPPFMPANPAPWIPNPQQPWNPLNPLVPPYVVTYCDGVSQVSAANPRPSIPSSNTCCVTTDPLPPTNLED